MKMLVCSSSVAIVFAFLATLSTRNDAAVQADTAVQVSTGDLTKPDNQGIQLKEEDRIVEYYKRNYTWPPQYAPNTKGWKALMERRFQQVAQLENNHHRHVG
jgi:hypothetical protein